MRIRIAATVLAVFLSVFFCVDGRSQSRTSEYTAAEAVFNKLTPEERVYAQTLMTAAGYSLAVPNIDFTSRMYDAVKRLQAEMGREQNGRLGPAELAQLERVAAPLFRQWGFRQVRHPDRPISIWVPFGLDLILAKDQYGLNYVSEKRDYAIGFKIFLPLDLNRTFNSTISDMREKGSQIHYSVLRTDFYAISSSTPNSVDRFERYHVDGQGIIGFNQAWQNSAIGIRGERIAALISASLWAQYNRIPLSPPERLLTQRYQPVLPPPPAQEASNQAPPLQNPPQPPKKEGSTGTGFVVTTTGHIVTNAHVVDNCSAVEILTPDNGRLSARLLARDEINDIALLSAPELKPNAVAAVRNGVKLGEQVVAFGYPLAGVLSVSGNFTLGNVTSLAGLGNDSRYLQISTPVQPGNSGGPLLDQHGNVVGIVSSKLNALRAAIATGDIPQNVNFALKVGIASNLLETSSVNMVGGSTEKLLSSVELADLAKRVSVQIYCRP